MTGTDNEEPGPGKATDEVEQVKDEVDEGRDEGGDCHKLRPPVPVPLRDHAADERYQTEHLSRHTY